ncbi:MAG: hypothetical protein WBQ14_00895 [Gaiellaceae bacterium]
MLRQLIDDVGEPASDASRRKELEEAALVTLRNEAPPTSVPASPAKVTVEQRIGEFELLLSAWRSARDRVRQAARREDDFSRYDLYIALAELLHWTYTIDLVFSNTWKGFDDATRETASARVDDVIADVIARNLRQASESGRNYREPQHGIIRAYRLRQQDGKPYAHWAYLAGIGRNDLDPRFIRGLRWIRGKFTHIGVIDATDLRQWREGAEPRWKWRPVSEISIKSRSGPEEDQDAYDAAVAGKDVIGSLNIAGPLWDVVQLLSQILVDQAAGTDLAIS